jgi:hypothetical protein
MATPSQIKDRIVALMAQVTGVTTSVDDYPAGDVPFTDAQLPAAVTRLLHAPATRRWLSGGIGLERRVYTVILHVAVIDNVDVLAPDTTVMETCEVFLDRVPKFFAARNRLHGTALAELVYDSELMSDGGIIRIERSGLSWWGLVFTLPVLEEFAI